MNVTLFIIVSSLVALLVGLLMATIFVFVFRRQKRELTEQMMEQQAEQMKAHFGTLALDALSKSTDEFLKLAKQSLENERGITIKEVEQRKGLIDEHLKRMNSELDGVTKLVKELEQDRSEKFGQLSSQLKATNEQTAGLLQTTHQLKQILSSSKMRGQWGERMADDVLKFAGFLENINYLKNKALSDSRRRPDFTFLLPNELKLNMDVKFPLDNYVKFVEAESDVEKKQFLNAFLRDVRSRMKEVTSRDYIDPTKNTLDYVLLFIPNEHIYAFIHEHDAMLMEDALKNRVVFCSPITLFAILAVIRQAVDTFALEKKSSEILNLLAQFKKEWGKFSDRLDHLGRKINDSQKEYDNLVGTRKRALERPLRKIDAVQKDTNQDLIDSQSTMDVLPEDSQTV